MPPDLAPDWLELPLSRTNFHGTKGVRAIEVRLYFTGEKSTLMDAISVCKNVIPNPWKETEEVFPASPFHFMF